MKRRASSLSSCLCSWGPKKPKACRALKVAKRPLIWLRSLNLRWFSSVKRRHVDNSHSSIVMVAYISCSWFFFKKFICNTLLHLLTTSRIMTAGTTVVPFCFQGQFWGGFTSTKKFCECCLMESTHPEVFFNEIWNIHRMAFF